MPMAIILRAISGGGKTTYAKKLACERSAFIFSLDQFFTGENGEYRFDERKISEAAADCMLRFLQALKTQRNLIVDNTNTRRWEYESYILAAKLAGYQVEIHEIVCRDLDTLRKFHKRNVHNVPIYVLGQQFARWEDDERTTVRVQDDAT